MNRINRLSPLIANQIAAGEVVERPASVVKELLENAFDANASQIHVEVGFGGLNFIHVSDNGTGILPQDLPLAIAPHATSKITQLSDLYAIDSMGFRGEALASIASVSRMVIRSKVAEEPQAMMLEVVGDTLNYTPCARTQGTSIEIHDLFYNAPVRKKFLKSERSEFQAIDQLVKRFAMSAPSIAMSLTHNGIMQWQVNAATCSSTMQTRIIKLLGKKFMDAALTIDEEHAGMHLKGWLAGADYQRSQGDGLWLYLNHRMVKDKLLCHAIKQAYAPILHPGRYPVCLLYFTIDPSEVDVNVHPTKHEVRFQQSRFVHDFILSKITQILIQQEQPATNGLPDALLEASSIEARLSQPSYTPQTIPAIDLYSPLDKNHAISSSRSAVFHSSISRGHDLLADSPRDFRNGTSVAPNVQFIPIDTQYSLLKSADSVHLVDLLVLKKNWYLERFEHAELPWPRRPLLVPIYYQNLTVDLSDYQALLSPLIQLGLEVSVASENKWMIRSVPINHAHVDIHLFFDKIIRASIDSIRDMQVILAQQAAELMDSLNTPEHTLFVTYVESYLQDSFNQGRASKVLSPEVCQAILYE